MIRAVLAYDDFDEYLGEYFDQSYKYINDIIRELDFDIRTLDGASCSEANINALLPTINHQPYIFAAFCHGDDDANSLVGSDNFVNVGNSHLFSTTLFYSSACNIGSGLATSLIQNGCQSFIGYTQVSHAPLNEDLNDTFIECELYALREFLTNGKSIQAAYDEMLRHIDGKIIELFEAEEYIDASNLQDNRDFFICLPENSPLTNQAFLV